MQLALTVPEMGIGKSMNDLYFQRRIDALAAEEGAIGEDNQEQVAVEEVLAAEEQKVVAVIPVVSRPPKLPTRSAAQLVYQHPPRRSSFSAQRAQEAGNAKPVRCTRTEERRRVINMGISKPMPTPFVPDAALQQPKLTRFVPSKQIAVHYD